MKLKVYFLFIGLVFIISSCNKNEEEPQGSIGEIEISEIKFPSLDIKTPPLMESENKKTAIASSWQHPLGSTLNLVFEPVSGKAAKTLNLNPSDLSNPYRIQLPYGSYSVRGSTSAPSTSDRLPISIEEELQVNTSFINYAPKSNTNYGLLTISKKGLQEKPRITSSENILFAETDGFYYIYAEMELEVTLSLFPNNSKEPFRTIWKAQHHLHNHLAVQKDLSEEIDSFIQTDFALDQEIIPLGEDFIPTALSPSLVSVLPESQSETSGIAYKASRLFSINDSGDDATLHELDPLDGKLLRRITIDNASNKDWESLAQSESHLFIADIGNNSGNRNDLVIYRVAWSDILTSNVVPAERIFYTYEDQSDFTGQVNEHNFDAEALVYANEKLHLFSKNRGDKKTKHYVIPDQTGNQSAKLIEEFDSQGLITGADFDPISGNLILIGYTLEGINSTGFLWLVSSINSDFFFLNSLRRLDLGSPVFLGQIEGISFSSDTKIYLSSEKISQGGFTLDQRLMKMDLSGFF